MLDKNYDANLETLTTKMEYQIFSTDGVMNPQKVETIFEQTIDSLNTLYEKSRFLDELYYYTEEKLFKDIETEIQKTKKLIAFIENNTDSYQVKACYSKNIAFPEQSPIKTLKDRDGSVLLKADVSNKVTLPYEAFSTSVDKINKTSSEYCYEDNISSINKNSELFYKSFYSLEQPNEIIETLTFLFDSPAELNLFDLSAYGANIVSVKIENESGESIEIDADQLITDTYSNTKKIIVTLVTNKFKKKTLVVDKADFTNNAAFSITGGAS